MPPEDDPMHNNPQVIIHSGDENYPGYISNPDGEEGLQYRQDGDEMELPPIDTTASHSANTVVMNQVKRTDDMHVVVDHNLNAGPSYNVVQNMVNNNGRLSSGIHYRRRRQVSGATEEDDIVLVVKELNYTIGTRFCVNDCPINNRTYMIPLSPFFAFQPVTLQFRMQRERQVTLCTYQPVARCAIPPDSTSGTITNLVQTESKSGEVVEWSLHIGNSFRTRYLFRIVEGQGLPSNNTREVCSLLPTRDLTIRDYELKFQRSCTSDGAK